MSAPFGRIDRTARRYFVYTLSDADGTPVYVGRSCNVAKRIRQHFLSIAQRRADERPATWLFDVRDVSLSGPYTWDEVVEQEKLTIRDLDPRANVALKRSA